jgi:hypothetical protein
MGGRRLLAALAGAAALVVLALVAGCGGAPARSQPATSPGCGQVSKQLVPECGAWLGIWPRTRADGTMTTDLAGNLASLERRLGRRVDLVSRYYGWGQLPPDGTDRAWRDSGHLLLIDLRARNFGTGAYTSWRSIADGTQDAYLRRVADRIRDFGQPVFFSFNQEPEQELERGTQVAGTAADYAAAYRHLHDVFAAEGARNAVWVWWTMGYLPDAGWYPDLYPGDAYVDWLSFDPYDFNTCHHTAARTPEQAVTPYLGWLAQHRLGGGKPVMLSEFGSAGTAQGGWYRALGALVRRTPRIKAIVSFDSNTGGCDTRVTASSDDWDGFAAVAGDPYFRQPH